MSRCTSVTASSVWGTVSSSAGKHPESLEEHRAQQPGLVLEQLVHRRHGGAGLLGHPPGGEPRKTVLVQCRDRDLQHSIAKLRGALLGPGHPVLLDAEFGWHSVYSGAKLGERVGAGAQFAGRMGAQIELGEFQGSLPGTTEHPLR